MVGAGFSNDVVFAKNVNFQGAKSATISTDGQLIIGSTALNVGGTHLNIGNLTSPNNSITFGYSSPNITAVVNTSVIQDRPSAIFGQAGDELHEHHQLHAFLKLPRRAAAGRQQPALSDLVLPLAAQRRHSDLQSRAPELLPAALLVIGRVCRRSPSMAAGP